MLQLSIRSCFSRLRYPQMAVAGMIIKVGSVDSKGFGVPFIECRTKVSNKVNTDGINTDASMAIARLLIPVARSSQLFINTPPKKKV